jgi:GT2 family glycosyltransferase
MFDVSIIIVSWNAKQHLLNCLNSLENAANGYSQEIIVVDNASSDGSSDAAARQFPQVRLVKNKENLGFARANNIGIRQSSGRYICLVNSDVIVLNGCIENLISFMDNHPTTGMVGPRILNPDRTFQPSCRHFPSVWNNLCQALGLNKLFPKSRFFSETFMNYWAHDTVQKVDVLSGCFWMVRRKALNEVGLLDEDFFIYGEDLDWCRRFYKTGWDVVFYPEAKAIHIGGASSSNAPIKFYMEMQKADLQYWRKHHGRIAAAIDRMIILLHHTLRVFARALQYAFCQSHRKTVGFKLRRSAACIRWVLHI